MLIPGVVRTTHSSKSFSEAIRTAAVRRLAASWVGSGLASMRSWCRGPPVVGPRHEIVNSASLDFVNPAFAVSILLGLGWLR